MDGDYSDLISEGFIRSIRFGMATTEEICTNSVSDSAISHPSQLANPFLGLPLESGKCESCGTNEPGKCEGHFGYIQLPLPVYHPFHISELRHILSLLCLKCLRMKKVRQSNEKGITSMTSCFYCRDIPPISVKERKTADGAVCLELCVPSRTRLRDGLWNFLDKYGFHHGDTFCRVLLPNEALNILKQIPEKTKKDFADKGYSIQNGFIMQCIPVPPNCLCVPEISDGKSIMTQDISISMLKRVLNKIEAIKKSTPDEPNYDSQKIDSDDLQSSIAQYMFLRGTTKTPQQTNRGYAAGTEAVISSAKKWLEKMKQLFISKGSGFSSRSVITGDPYIGINQIGLPSEIAKKVTFEERVTVHNAKRLQGMVDERLCVTYKDGSSTYAIAVGSKGHTSLRVGQVINRQIMDGDMVFVNRPPSTHKHSLQAFSVVIHDDHTIKLNPLICAPLGADFDGDCIHIFYPQSLDAKAEAAELFSIENQLLSSHDGNLLFKLVNDSLLALKFMFNKPFLNKAIAQQLAMFAYPVFQPPALVKVNNYGPFWSAFQVLQCAMPADFDCRGESFFIKQKEIMKLDFDQNSLQSCFMEIISSIFQKNGSKETIKFFNRLQPLLMEVLALEGYSISLKDFDVPTKIMQNVRNSVQEISYLLRQFRTTSNELLEAQIEEHLRTCKIPIAAFIINLSAMGKLIDSKSNSSVAKIVQQIGFLGQQLYNRGKLYSRDLVDDVFSHIVNKYSSKGDHPCEAFGLINNSFFNGLSAYEALIHSVSTREVIVRSSRGLTEPGTLFKNLMAILRDVVVCYDGTIRNVCSNSVVQFEYGLDEGRCSSSISVPGDPVGVLAATAISNPSYKAVLDSSQSNNSSWERMKEILLCKANHKNDVTDRRVILYLNDCSCGKKFCKENTAFRVQNCLKRVTLKDCATYFLIEYQKQIIVDDSSGTTSGLVGHIQLDERKLVFLNQSTDAISGICKEVIEGHRRNKKGNLSNFFKKVHLSVSECHQKSNWQNFTQTPCLHFSYSVGSESLERAILVMANIICPILLDTIIKGVPKVQIANIIWIEPEATSWVKNSSKASRGELAVEVVIEKDAVRRGGDAWRTTLDACLPVMHLIDTRRSIPYGIQQIQELLGVSCAFEQSVLRLSTSIKMVEKGVLKEHLILIGNSMTCTGKLIGFNRPGFTALFRSLKVQVPFTEATVYTPMKCFEKSADKCHTDSIASVVSSCSWGKHVAIGTGTHFQILWDKKQMLNDHDTGEDVYDFLEVVRTVNRKHENISCSGFDVDDLMDEDGYNEICSPERDASIGKPTFDDDSEIEWKPQNGASMKNWEKGNSTWEKISATSDGWGIQKMPSSGNAQGDAAKPDVWSSWHAGDMQEKPVESAVVADEVNPFHSFGKVELRDRNSDSGQSDHTNSWETKNAENRAKLNQPKSPAVWNANVTTVWDNQISQKANAGDSSDVGGWRKTESENGWGRAKQLPEINGWNASGNQKTNFTRPGRSDNRKGNIFPSPRRPVSFSNEEEKILFDVQRTITSIKRIMRDSSLGQRVSADDQKFIIENVFHYHPDKETKLAGPIDHIMVDKHEVFQESKCFYAVSCDGSKADFSYNKCMKNYVSQNFPEIAESFNSKFFIKHQSDPSKDSVPR